MTQQVPNEKELLEILELARVAEEKARQMAEMATAIAKKYEGWYKAKQAQKLAAAQNKVK
ncbi:MAG: hypothetical protein AB4426_34675 [Xenococcaceae cyanobacterium]